MEIIITLSSVMGAVALTLLSVLGYSVWRSRQEKHKRGMSAAGYWWSERDRRLGPG